MIIVFVLFFGVWGSLAIYAYAKSDVQVSSKFLATCREGEYLPAWYYGFAYWDYPRDIAVFYPMPFNFLVRGWRWLASQWHTMRSIDPSYNEYYLINQRDYHRRLEDEYLRGYRDGSINRLNLRG